MLAAVGFLGSAKGQRSAFFSNSLKGLTIVQICIIFLFALAFFFKPAHKEYTDLVDKAYYVFLLVCSLLLWILPAIGYFLAKMTFKVKAALNED